MCDFKIGDRVRLNRDFFGGFKAGDEFEVVPIGEIRPGYWIQRGKVGLYEGKPWGDYDITTFSGVFDVVSKDKPERQIQFVIQEGNIEAAARFIVGHNKYMSDKTVNYFVMDIKRTIKHMVDKIKAGREVWYSGTAGYTVIFNKEDEDYYVIDVLCDPAVSEDGKFVNVEEIL